MESTLGRLQRWYRAQCDGEWEHEFGIKIDTLDNPGWTLKVDLVDTNLSDVPFEAHEDQYDDEINWLRAWRDPTNFHVACGATRFEDALTVFLNWAEGSGGSKTG